MTGTALLIAAHGSSEPGVNEGVHRLARRVAGRLGLVEATAAFHDGDPDFSRVLDAISCDQVVVVPLFQSEGYYCERVLPARLARNRRFSEVRLLRTPAVGVHPGLGVLLAARVEELAASRRLAAPAVALVAHGTPRHQGSRRAAEAAAREVERRSGLPARAFFLDEEPALESASDHARERDLVVVPLFLGAGRHATHDVARRLGAAAPSPAARAVVVDRPIGLDPGIEEIVAALAAQALDSVSVVSAASPDPSSKSVNRSSRDR